MLISFLRVDRFIALGVLTESALRRGPEDLCSIHLQCSPGGQIPGKYRATQQMCVVLLLGDSATDTTRTDHSRRFHLGQEPRLHVFCGRCGDKSSHDEFLLGVRVTRGRQTQHRQPHELQVTRGKLSVRDGGFGEQGRQLHHPRPRQHMASLR